MAINKVIFNDNTIMDITDTTAVASDVLQGKYFYGADGIKTLGTLAESAGLEYEQGTYVPAEDTTEPTIYFSNTHEKPPMFWLICDTTETVPDDNTSALAVCVDTWRLTGTYYHINNSNNGYGYLYGGISRNSNFWENIAPNHFYYDSDTPVGYSGKNYYPRNFYDETCFKPIIKTSYGYWRSNRTYKWIAIWK